jgi:hypothetical protein
MGNVISRNASPERIKEAASKTLTVAKARGGEMQNLTEARIVQALAALESNEQQLGQARVNDDTL